MYCDKENINILTSLLVAHGVRKAVVCPGSRNAAIVHNLNECPEMTCYPVTDERSAGFFALGLSLADDEPVAVCVTSGTAVLNLAPAVAEATYRHHGLVVITADRPAAWIGQLDGQTLVQPGAFGCHVGKSVSLPEPHDEEERWFCNRMVNEALISVKSRGRASVQINVPVSEPMFNFCVKSLPVERKIEHMQCIPNMSGFEERVLRRMFAAERPMIVVGASYDAEGIITDRLRSLSEHVVVISECLSSSYFEPFDMALKRIGDDMRYMPDFIIYLGDTMVSKRMRNFLRQAKNAECWEISPDGEVHDVFMNLAGMLEGSTGEMLEYINDMMNLHKDKLRAAPFVDLWREQFSKVKAATEAFEPRYSQMAAVKEFFMSLEDMEYDCHVHSANSMAVRLACIYAEDYVWCNRGVNGIEGSLSTAAGFSCATEDMVFCITGDLSFFYDQNALWNQNTGGNFRTVLLNNGGGEIFRSLKGLSASPAFESMVSATHGTTAKGLCEDNDIGYLSARNMDELRLGMARLLTMETKRPMVLEVITDAGEDSNVFKEYIDRVVAE